MGLWTKFKERAFVTKNLAALGAHSSDGQLKRCLTGIDLTMLGVGAMIGAGVFVLTGEAAHEYAGPAVILSYAIASAVATVTALCYTEFAVDLPVAGSAFNYVSLTFGEFIAWVVATEMIMEYTLTSAAVAKGFSGYFATMLTLDSNFFTLWKWDFIVLDPAAFGLIVVLSTILAFGVRESSTFNIAVTSVNLACIFLVLFAAIPRINKDNYTPFLPETGEKGQEMGMKGVFRASSVVFYGYVGFDALATAAEEVRKPSRDIPAGMLGSLAVCTTLYVLMATAITGMAKYTAIDLKAPFAVVFNEHGQSWIGEIVSIGAVTGTATAALVMLLGQARIHMVLGRERFVPAWLAKVNERNSVPVNATIFTMITSGLPALFLDIDILARMVSMGTLTTMCMVCAGVVWRAYVRPTSPVHPDLSAPEKESIDGKQPAPVWAVLLRLVVIVVASIVEGLASENGWGLWVIGISLAVWLVTTLSFYALPVIFRPQYFNVPLKPIVPSVGILASVHLICSLGVPAYIRFGIWQIFGIGFYFVYSLHQSRDAGKEQKQPLLDEGTSGRHENEQEDS